jgi:hypothetical protein
LYTPIPKFNNNFNNDTPVDWFSDGSLHSQATVDRHSSDEYSDEYTNISNVRFNDDAKKTSPAAKKTGHVSSEVDNAKSPQMSGPPDSFGPSRAKLCKTAQLRRKRQQLRSSQSASDLQHVPLPHRADKCDTVREVECLQSVDINLALGGSTSALPDVPEDGVSTPDRWMGGTSCPRRTERSRGATPPYLFHVYSRNSCVVLSSALIKHQCLVGFHSVCILYCRWSGGDLEQARGKMLIVLVI